MQTYPPMGTRKLKYLLEPRLGVAGTDHTPVVHARHKRTGLEAANPNAPNF